MPTDETGTNDERHPSETTPEDPTESSEGTPTDGPGETVSQSASEDASVVDDAPEGRGEKPEKAHDEQYCESCGSVIKKKAAVCPECGVSTPGATGGTRSSGSTTTQEPMDRYPAAGIGGGVALVVGFFLPIVGQVGGGAVTGFLRGPDAKESTICGGISGLIAAIPAMVIFGLLLFLGAIGSMSEGASALGGIVAVGLILVLFVAIYAGLGALGGFIGSILTDREAPLT